MNYKLLLCSLLLLAAGGWLCAQTAATTGTTTAAGGFDYSRGRYGLAATTEVFSVPAELSHESGPWLFRATGSWLTIKGPSAAALTGGDGGLTRPTSASESGLGDLYLELTHRTMSVHEVNLDTTARVKLPTADEARGLGTGEADYYLQVTGHRTIGQVTPFATLGYRVLGDSVRYPLRDGFYATGGAHLRTSDRTVVTAALDWRSRILRGADPGIEASVGVTHDLTPRWRVFAYALAGFTDASPDAGTGLRLSYRF